MAFNPKNHLMTISGKKYLPVAARVLWFREVHPGWGIETEPLEINSEKQYAIYRATIRNEEGRIMAQATKREDVKGFGDWLEKSEMGSIGRALGLCGFGTQFDASFHEGVDRVVDSPQEDAEPTPVRTKSVTPRASTQTAPSASEVENYWGLCVECEEPVYYRKMTDGTFLLQEQNGEKHKHQAMPADADESGLLVEA